jgi:heme A synthase
MLFVQVILGGGSTVLRFPAAYHLVWGTLTFVALAVATFLLAKDHGTKSRPFLAAVTSMLDFVVQGLLGLASFGSAIMIVVHLANAFVLAALVTWLVVLVSSVENRITE